MHRAAGPECRRLDRHFPDTPQIQGNRNAIPPPRNGIPLGDEAVVLGRLSVMDQAGRVGDVGEVAVTHDEARHGLVRIIGVEGVDADRVTTTSAA